MYVHTCACYMTQRRDPRHLFQKPNKLASEDSLGTVSRTVM